MERVVSEFRRRARLPGFRKGKVPADVVKRRFREDIEQEVVERLLPRYWRQAEAESELDPLLPPSVDEVDLRPGEALTFVASVEVRPEIDLQDIESFELPEMDTEPGEAEIERALEDLRRAVSEWRPVNRAAAQGDLVVAELEHVEPQEGEPADANEVSFEVGDPQVWEELSLEATGKSAGQSGEFSRPGSEGDDPPARRFRLTVKEIKERELPELDDELAAKLGKFDSVEALQQDVQQRLRQAKEAERRQARERAAVDQLRERHPLELPSGVVDREIEGMLSEYAQSLASSGVDVQDPKLDWQAMAEQVRPQASKRVHARLLLDAVAARLGIEVPAEEFEATLARLARAQGRTAGALRQELDRAGRLVELRHQLRRERALRSLLGEVVAAEENATESLEDSP